MVNEVYARSRRVYFNFNPTGCRREAVSNSLRKIHVVIILRPCRPEIIPFDNFRRLLFIVLDSDFNSYG